MNLSIFIQPSAVSKDAENSDAGPSVDNYEGYSLIQSMLMEEATWFVAKTDKSPHSLLTDCSVALLTEHIDFSLVIFYYQVRSFCSWR